jgi:hypothetical protein
MVGRHRSLKVAANSEMMVRPEGRGHLTCQGCREWVARDICGLINCSYGRRPVVARLAAVSLYGPTPHAGARRRRDKQDQTALSAMEGQRRACAGLASERNEAVGTLAALKAERASLATQSRRIEI